MVRSQVAMLKSRLVAKGTCAADAETACRGQHDLHA